LNKLLLHPGREKSLLRRHPWIFSGAVARVDGTPRPGETVLVADSRGRFLAFAAYSPASKIRARVWSFDEEDTIDAAFFRRRIDAALKRRAGIPSNAYRLVHAESDGLPGFIADKYDETLVLQFLSAGAEYWRETLTDALLDATGLRLAYERSDVEVRRLEGLPLRAGALRGAPPDRVLIEEYGARFLVDIARGHKTGFYLDQRANRFRVGALVEGREVLNSFSYTGGFTIHALRGGAKSVVSIDSSADALSMEVENLRRNGMNAAASERIEGDVFQVLRKFRDARRAFDVIILDPPKFAPTAAQAAKAARGYKDINLLAFKLLRSGGILATFSCSGGISDSLFQKIVADAALDAGVNAVILARLAQDKDHPVSLNFPEGAYLKGLICRKD
jgi:23S rRNA (cytosine1962-C5)-methyltransferase